LFSNGLPSVSYTAESPFHGVRYTAKTLFPGVRYTPESLFPGVRYTAELLKLELAEKVLKKNKIEQKVVGINFTV